MSNAPVYIAASFLQRFVGFFVDWYGGGTRVFFLSFLRLHTVLKNLFGYTDINSPILFVLLGLLVVLKFLIYALAVIIFIFLYLGWLAFPILATFKVVSELFL